MHGKAKRSRPHKGWLRATLDGLLYSGLICSGCAQDTGTLAFEVWGEAYIEEGISRDEFADGWEVEYDEFVVVLDDLRVANPDEIGAELQQSRLFDLTRPGPHGIGEMGVQARSWSDFSFDISPATKATQAHSSAQADQLARMQAEGWSIFASGSANKGERQLDFAWGFSTSTRYHDCVDIRGGQQTQGVVVGRGTESLHQITVHGDHLFYDDLASDEAVLRFEAIADADSDSDGHITLAELDAIGLAELATEAGSYGVGSLDVDTLGDFVRAATASVGHFNGEGHCQTTTP